MRMRINMSILLAALSICGTFVASPVMAQIKPEVKPEIKFKVAWQEKLDVKVASNPSTFCVGDLKGDGKQRLAMIDSNDGESFSMWKYTMIICSFVDGKFKLDWQSDPFTSMYRQSLRIVPEAGMPAHICYAGEKTRLWQYDAKKDIYASKLASDSLKITDVIVKEQPYVVFSQGYSPIIKKGEDFDKWVDGAKKAPYVTWVQTIGDVDLDGKDEVAAIIDGGNVGIYTLDSKEKSISATTYGNNQNRITLWYVKDQKTPYIVVNKNYEKGSREEIKYDFSKISLLKYDGKEYVEVWSSDEIKDIIVDMQVCDPKTEGTLGLVALSTNDAGCMLTKIVAE